MFTNRLKFTRTLHGRFLLALVLIGIIPVGLIGLGISILDSRAISEQSAQELTGLARGLAGQLDIYVAGMLEDSRAIAALLDIVSMNPARQGPLLKELFHHRARFARLSTFDPSGKLLASSHPGTPSSIAMRESFQTAAESGRQAWMVATTLSTGRSSLLIHTPIRDAKRRVVGVLGAVVDLEDLSAAISSVHVGGGGQAFVIDAAGRVLLHQDKAAIQERLDYSWIGIPTGGRPAGPGTVRYDAAGESRVAGYAVIPNTAWTVVVERPEVDILIPAKRSLRLALTGLTISVVLALVAAAFFSLKLTRPVRELAQAARAFAAGDPLAPLPLVPAGESELGTLVEAFDAMRGEVEAREKRLRAAEKKVRDLVEFAPDAIIGVKEDGCIAVVNTQAERLFGYSRGEMLGQPVEVLLPERLRETHVAHRLTYYSQPKARLMGSGRNLYGRRKDGSEFHAQISLSPMETEEGSLVTSIIRDVTDSKEKEQQIRRSLDQIRALGEIDRAITSTLDLRTVLDVLLEKIDLVLPYSATTVRLVNTESGLLEPVACRNLDEKEWKAEQWKGGRGTPNVVFERKSPWMVRNVQTDPSVRDPEFFRRHGLVSYLGVPLIVKDEILGVISFYTKEEHEFSHEEVEFLTTLAGQAAIAIHNSQLYKEARTRETELQETNRMLSALHTVAAAASQSLDLDRVLQAVIEKITEIFRFDATRIHLYNERVHEFLLEASFETDPDRFTSARSFKRGQGIVGKVADSGKPLIFEDVETDPLYRQLSQTKLSIRYGYHFFAVFPIKGRLNNLGTLGCVGVAPRKLSSGEVQLLEALADQIAVAIENSELYEDVRQKVRELQGKTAELEKLNKVKDEFLSVMSHELRTPLNVIIGYTGMIKDGMLGEINSEHERALGKVMSHSKELLTMISGILEATRFEAEEVTVNTDEVRLGDFLDELKSIYAVSLDKGLTLYWDYPSDLRVIKTDSEKLKQILQNLINNAIKFTEKGSVTISARIKAGSRQQAEDRKQQAESSLQGEILPAGQGWVEFKVADTGIGIEKESFPVIFEKFRQVDSSETRPYGGVGMGLYIAKKFTELLGGKIEVESEPGKGSVFTVTIPCDGNQSVVKDQTMVRTMTEAPPHEAENGGHH